MSALSELVPFPKTADRRKIPDRRSTNLNQGETYLAEIHDFKKESKIRTLAAIRKFEPIFEGQINAANEQPKNVIWDPQKKNIVVDDYENSKITVISLKKPRLWKIIANAVLQVIYQRKHSQPKSIYISELNVTEKQAIEALGLEKTSKITHKIIQDAFHKTLHEFFKNNQHTLDRQEFFAEVDKLDQHMEVLIKKFRNKIQ